MDKRIERYINGLLVLTILMTSFMVLDIVCMMTYFYVNPIPIVEEYKIEPCKHEVIEEIIVVDEVIEAAEVEEEPIDEEELELLAHLIYAEAGAEWCDDEMLYQVGSVVLNRMASDYFPSTMYEVIYQEGQYACTWDGNIEKEPDERAYRIAEDLLRNGSTLPENVIFQAQFKQGDGVYAKVQNMYFCYIKEDM